MRKASCVVVAGCLRRMPWHARQPPGPRQLHAVGRCDVGIDGVVRRVVCGGAGAAVGAGDSSGLCRCAVGSAAGAGGDRSAGGCGHGVVAGGGRRGVVRTRSGEAGRVCVLQPGGGAGGEGRVPGEHAGGEQGLARGAADGEHGPAGQGVPRPVDRVQLRGPTGARRAVRQPVAEVSGHRPDPGERSQQEGAGRRAHAAEAL